MSNIDRSAVNFESLNDEDMGTRSTTSKTVSSKSAGFGKKKEKQGPWIKGGKGGKGPSSKQSKASKTSGKFGGSREGHPQGKGANSKIR